MPPARSHLLNRALTRLGPASAPPRPGLATLIVRFNRCVALGLAALGTVLLGLGLWLGAFGWLNSGQPASLGLVSAALSFGAAFTLSSLLFRAAAAAHAQGRRLRWALEALALLGAPAAFALAAATGAILDALSR